VYRVCMYGHFVELVLAREGRVAYAWHSGKENAKPRSCFTRGHKRTICGYFGPPSLPRDLLRSLQAER
jgi:hypothetical protein